MSDPYGTDPTVLSKAHRGGKRLSKGCILQVTEGPERGQRFAVDGQDGGRVFLGQSEACAIKLTDPEVSRRHAAFELAEEGVRLSDLASTNGTFVGGLRVFDVLLTGGESIRVGGSTLRVESLTEAPAPTSSADRFYKMLGKSSAMRRIYPHCERLASAAIPVLIEGETGTGKEVLAESLHDASPRRAGPFVVLDCTTISPNLAEATIFGHERGAFTGADTSRAGVFEEAHGGTLFIDEIGDLDIALQAKLLRAIERSEIRRVGGARVLRVDVRILSATRRNIEQEIHEGRFRDDLYFRLAVGRVELPPLRKREGDVAFLAEAFSRALGAGKDALGIDLLQRLEDYAWPGNVRELRNVIVQHHALGEAPLLAGSGSNQDRTELMAGGANPFDEVIARELPFFSARDAVLRAFELKYLTHVLAQHGGHVGNAAEASGIGRRYFQRIRNRAKAE